MLVEKDSFLIEFQQVLSEFSNCRPRKKNPGREFTKKKLPVESSKKKSRSRIHKKKLPVENSQKKIPVENSHKKNPGREFTKKLPVENSQKKKLPVEILCIVVEPFIQRRNAACQHHSVKIRESSKCQV